jgi:hypothetical protein
MGGQCTAGDLVCQQGMCTSCGATGQTCCTGGVCDTGLGCQGGVGGGNGGTCQACGAMGQACCGGAGGFGGTCNMGFVCAAKTGDAGNGFSCQACGASTEPCCANRTCNSGLMCMLGMGVGGTCQ